MTYTFETTCIDSTSELINDMRDSAFDSSLVEMRKDCEGLDQEFRRLGYDEDLTIEDDWHVDYQRSMYDGKPCIYFVWSAIEFIFIKRRLS